ncbi:BAH domain [Popillia japonica]|uniref:BAH domain n=1 Tax=Popillia japonica TaxID=7064 RepID=A0AAW1MER2_POPJA
MSKRRRTSSIASRGQEEDSLDSIEATTSSGPPKKRSKKQDPMELCQQLYESVRNHKKHDGTLLCDSFIRVPKRRQEPGYYDVVSNPIDLLKVQQKLKTDEYDDIEDLQSDIELIVSNAKAFYKRNTQEYKDACELLELFITNKIRLLEGRDDEADTKNKIILKVTKFARKADAEAHKHDIDHSEDTSESSTNQDDDNNPYEDLFMAVMSASDNDNRPLYTEFQLLPSKKKYPEYYEIIENPIDLKSIATKIQNNDYNSLLEMERDLLIMTKNACLFNEPGSQIYKNAKTLKKIITSKRIEIEHNKSVGGKSSERIRNKRLRGSTSLSAVTAALRDEDSDGDLELEESMEEEIQSQNSDHVDTDNPQWQLFEAVRSVTNNSGAHLSDPFWRLPSKRFYPDYYKEIKNPVSLMQIRRKLVNKSYGTVSEVAGDMTIMFENAKKYNVQTSKLYKDAVKLQKVMQAKVQELLDIDQDTDSDAESEDSKILLKRKPGPKPKNTIGCSPGRPGRPSKDTLPLKKRLHTFSKYLLDYTCEDGRKPMLGFMEKPSKKLYPEYYEVILEPIDFLEIESKIRGEQYRNEQELINDFKLMFSNCRQFNEENSTIFEDANLLEKIMNEKAPQLIPTPEKEKKIYVRVSKPRRILSPTEKNCRVLYDTIRDYREPKANRQLALIFMKLPSKNDYPDYYEVIKSPIDMERISHKLKNSGYETLDDLVSDFILMFDNACKYNEPDSQIYKDALVLQRVCLQTKLQLKEDDDTVPDVPAAIQDLLLNLFTNVYNHQDIDERCYSDSMADLPEHDEIDGKKVRAVSLDLIKRRLDKGLYRRLDTFQDDFFACLDRARRLSRSDSQVFEDSIELQTYFIKQRDELCKNGELLHSPALSYTLMHLTAAVESLRQSKILQESLEDESETRSSDDSIIRDTTVNVNVGESMTCNQQTYKVGEFVYLDAKEKGCEPHILLIERLWTNNGQQMLYGNYFLRPVETYHVQTRKFLEKEVFKSDTHVAVPLEEVKERCCVMNVKQYFTMKPEGFDEKDVYVCESRYSTRTRSFKKIKIYPENPSLVLVSRDVPIEPKRVMSVFRERVEKHKDELAELQEQEKLIEKEKPNVVAFTNMDIDDGNTYYEQYNTICSGIVKTGDFVYVAAEGGRQMIAQIDSIWDTKDGKCYFRGPWFVTPPEVPLMPNRTFYKNELFLSTLEDTNPLVGIMGKCSVLDYNEYISSRITEISEQDVYICNSMYDEINRQVRKLPLEGLKKFSHSNAVTDDEVYYFPKLINPPKVGSQVAQQPEPPKQQNPPVVEVNVFTFRTNNINNNSLKINLIRKEASPVVLTKMTDVDMLMEDSLDGGPPSVGSGEEASPVVLTKMTDVDMLMEDSLDGGPPSVGSGEIPTVVPTVVATTSTTTTPVTAKKKSNKNKVVTGYILYSREVRKSVVQNNPDSNFGEISKIVGNEWRTLSTGEKQAWEEKASKLNEEAKALLLEEQCSSPANIQDQKSNKNKVVTGYILYSREVRKSVVQNNPDSNFGEISKIVGNEWRSLSAGEKQAWEEKASKLNEETKALLLEEQCSSPANNQDQIFECLWDNCDFQFEETGYSELHCQWRNCLRNNKKNVQPFPNLARLARHVRDMHINKGNGRHVPPADRSKNFKPSSKPSVARPTPSATPTPPASNSFNSTAGNFTPSTSSANTIVAPPPPKQQEPLFITVPPRPQRVLHSEAYIKYIEGLNAENRFISPWEKTLNVTQESVPTPDPEKLTSVTTWLGSKVNQQENVLNALWALRNQLLKDTLSLQKTL